ncbi:MAG: hypothetical protein R3D33_09585 [Hyphomicrobiaceae bacterium]
MFRSFSRPVTMLGAAAVLLAFAGAADAGNAGRRPYVFLGQDYDRVTVTKKPIRGYSGSALNSSPAGGTFIHCDYHRIPIRKCNASGRCRAVAWELHEYCY